MTISIRGARVIDPASGLDQVGDLHIEAGKIVAISGDRRRLMFCTLCRIAPSGLLISWA
ncbi:hypothetical protein HKT23_30195, partial [Pseudomonas aeruginosa]|nr:hypothetical protein [Pseudomonas aeruginosa]